ncbi:PAP2 superfamily protein [Loa loa]|uniref:Target of rapamycin complex 2 subunit MAPKAP1 n=1 Tax=Loa loa TaxID=7209 RepID=A0A1I7VCC9_LOALO|nr:PAP2 superfamily protein [Loa loa]EJD74287.1 PAP2 superfamily protein [Loa loa]
MACFDPDELADFIRYQCIINADDDGQCRKILRPPSRKAKPGGLPLNFRSAADSDTSSGEHSPCYLATADCESTYELLQERLRSRIQEYELLGLDDEEKVVKNSTVDAWPSTTDLEFFQCGDISCTPSPPPVQKSITALLLEKTDFVIRSDLAAYARFATPDIENGRKLLVFYPFVEPEPKSGKCFSLTIYAQCDICISDLVGLCCYEYARCQRTNDIGSVAQYHLLMAEENGEVDRDLPPVDGHRLLSELGSCWSTIALEKRRSNNCFGMKNIIVYTVSGKQYEFPMDSLDVPLRWLRDQAIQKRIDDEGQEFMSDCPAYREYVLEAVRQPDVALDLNKPISSTACLEFLLLRINSSRGDFTPTCCSKFAQGHSPIPKIHDDLISSSLEQRQFSDMIYKTTTSSVSSIDAKDLLGNSIAFYPVEKIHRYKPKWNALLTIRTDGFELTPNQSSRTRERNSVLLHSSLKTLYVTWDYVGGVEITNHSNSKRGVRIVWLAYPTIKHQSKIAQTSKLTNSTQDSILSLESDRLTDHHEPLRQKLYNNACWKILQLEADVDDAWSITGKINTIIDDRNSAVHQIYKYSNGGTKKPKKAAAKAFGRNDDAQFKKRNSSISHTVRRISQLTSGVAGPVPILLKLFSKRN